jgi:hypothetical protein
MWTIMAPEVENREPAQVTTSTEKSDPVSPPPPRPPLDERFRAFLGIALGIVSGAVLWMALIQLIRKLT